MSQYEVRERPDGGLGVWNLTTNRWANRVRHADRRSANADARRLELDAAKSRGC